MRGLALEGGGARGAYHIGVIKALYENGYEFTGYTGTSIGAVNAAVLAQGDFELALQIWLSISLELVFDVNEQYIFKPVKISELRRDKELANKIRNAIRQVINNKGIKTEKMKSFLDRYLDEDKLRNSKKDFGLVTVSLTERKPYELMLDDIPYGQLINYIMASASFPGFLPERIDGKAFIDGGFYNNCPMNLLLDKGYDEIIAIRTNTPGIVRIPEDNDKIKMISPSEDLGNILWFSSENSEKCINIGYKDGLRFISTCCQENH